MKTNPPENLPKMFRTIACEARVVLAEGQRAEDVAADAPIEIAISSEAPVDRWFGIEILDHSPAAINKTFFDRGMAFLVAHDQYESSRLQAGLVVDLSVGKDRILRGKVKFSSDAEAQRVRQDMLDGIRPYISVGYRVDEYVLEKTGKDGDTYRATKWTPGEVSTVAVPADASVGVGRSKSEDLQPVLVRKSAELAAEETQQETRTMDPTTTEIPAGPAVSAEAQRQATEAALQARNKEVSEIVQLAIAHGCGERADEWISSGKSPGQVAQEILAAKRSAPLRQPASERAPGVLTDVSKKPAYSLRAAIAGAVGLTEGKAFTGFEAEWDQEIRKALPAGYKTRGGILIPEAMGSSPQLDRAMRRMLGMQVRAGLDSQTATSGAEIVFDIPGEFIELLRNMAITTRMGATVLAGLGSPVTFPKQTAAGTATWVGENPGSDVSDSDIDLGTIALAPKTLMSSTSLSRQLIAQQSFDAEAMIRRDLAAIHALAIDKAAIHGLGSSNEPTGIYAAAGVNSVAMGGNPTFAKLVNMVTECAVDNALSGTTGFATTPGMAGKLKQTLVASSAGSEMIWMGRHESGVVTGYPAASSNQVSAVMTGSAPTGGSEHGIVFGNWADLLIGTWGALEIIVDPYRLKKQAMIELTSYQLADILLRRGQSFCKATGATIS